MHTFFSAGISPSFTLTDIRFVPTSLVPNKFPGLQPLSSSTQGKLGVIIVQRVRVYH